MYCIVFVQKLSGHKRSRSREINGTNSDSAFITNTEVDQKNISDIFLSFTSWFPSIVNLHYIGGFSETAETLEPRNAVPEPTQGGGWAAQAVMITGFR